MNYRDFFKNKKATAKDIKNLIPEGVDPKEFQMGVEDEKEHTDNEFLAAKIAGDHLKGDKHYYSKLKNAGLEEENCEEHCGACQDDMGNDYDDNGGLPKIGGALAVRHVGQPIMMGKIVQVGNEFGHGTASGELSGMTSISGRGVTKDKGGIPVTSDGDRETLTAGGKKFDGCIASKSVGGEVVSGEGQRQGGRNSQGTIASTAKLNENKEKIRRAVKNVLKEIRFDKKSGKWVKLNEFYYAPPCKKCGEREYQQNGENLTCKKCGTDMSSGKQGKLDEFFYYPPDDKETIYSKDNIIIGSPKSYASAKGYLQGTKCCLSNENMWNQYIKIGYRFFIIEIKDENTFIVGIRKDGKKEIFDKNDRPVSEEQLNSILASHNVPTGLIKETVNMKMGKSYKTVQPRQYKVSNDDTARTNQYEPEITEMYDEEEESIMNERYVELANASRNLNESELSELKELREKIDRLGESKRMSKKDQEQIWKDVHPSEQEEDKFDNSPFKKEDRPSRKMPEPYKMGGKFKNVDNYTGASDIDEGRCEDYPCCGHDAGQCPTEDEHGNKVYRCVCGAKLPPNSRSSLCQGCLRRGNEEDYGDYGDIDEVGGQEVQHRSFRTSKDVPQNSKVRWNDEISEGTKTSAVSKAIKKGMKSKSGAKSQSLKHKNPKKTSTGVHKRKT